jgi:hypothetical protein
VPLHRRVALQRGSEHDDEPRLRRARELETAVRVARHRRGRAPRRGRECRPRARRALPPRASRRAATSDRESQRCAALATTGESACFDSTGTRSS